MRRFIHLTLSNPVNGVRYVWLLGFVIRVELVGEGVWAEVLRLRGTNECAYYFGERGGRKGREKAGVRGELTAMTTQHKLTYGLSRSPMRAHFQNMPRKLVRVLVMEMPGLRDCLGRRVPEDLF